MYPLLYFSFNVSILKVSQIILINICITYLYTTSGLFVNKSLEPETKVKTFSKILIHPQNLLRQIPLICSIQKMRKQYVACVQSMCGQQVSKIRLTHMVQLQSLLVSPCSCVCHTAFLKRPSSSFQVKENAQNTAQNGCSIYVIVRLNLSCFF